MYTRLTKKSLLWCLRFGSCTNLGQKGVNVALVFSFSCVEVLSSELGHCLSKPAPYSSPLLGQPESGAASHRSQS